LGPPEPQSDAPARRLRRWAGAGALLWLALLLPALVHFGALLDHEYKFFESWVLGGRKFTRASARIDGIYFALCMAALLAVWLAALRLTARAPSGAGAGLRRVALAGALGFALLGFLQVPFTSADPFYYRGVGLAVAAGENPYAGSVEREIPFTEPPIKAERHPPLWGPLMLWLFGAAVAVAGPGVLAGIYALKLSVLAFHVLNLWLVGRIVREADPDAQAWALVCYGWSPLFVFEHASIGHNDPPMLSALLASVWLVQRARWTAACLAVAVGAAFKAPALLAALPLALCAFARLGAAAWRPLALGAALSALLLAALYAPFWAGLDTFSGLLHFRGAHFASVPQALRLACGLPPLPRPGETPPLERALALFWWLAFAAGCALVARSLWRRRTGADARDYAQALVALFLVYLVTQQQYFWSWYAAWPLALAAVSRPRSAAAALALAAALGAMLGSAVYRFVHPLESFTAPVQWAAIALSFGPLAVAALLRAARERGAGTPVHGGQRRA
jgi:hypothetical protein